MFILWQENHALAIELRAQEEERRKQLAWKYYERWRWCVMETRAAILCETNLLRRVGNSIFPFAFGCLILYQMWYVYWCTAEIILSFVFVLGLPSMEATYSTMHLGEEGCA
jgi:hypothetical protein